MSRFRFRTKIAFAFVAAGAIVLAVTFLGFRREFRHALVRDDRTHLRGRARRVARRHLAGKAPVRRAHQRDMEIGAALFRPDGTLIAALPADGVAPPIPAELPRQSAAAGGGATTDTLLGADGSEFRVLAEYFAPRDGDAASGPGVVVVTYHSLAAIDARTDEEMAEALATALPTAVLVGLVAAWLVARSLGRPLARMADEADAAANLAHAGTVTGSGAGDELDVLARVLNATFARLRAAFERQSRFTSDAAHELRTPVAAILGRADVALRKERSAEEYRAALADVRGVAAGAARTVESLLQLARLDARDEIESQVVDVRSLVERAVVAARARHEVSEDALRLEVASGAYHVIGDESLLEVLFRNIIENALTHGGSERGVDVRLRPDGAACLLVVHDHGAGIPADHVGPVFDRLHRVDAARSRALGGAGLGLSIVRAVAEAHGGTATLRSAPGSGTTVTVTLPTRMPA